MSKDTDNPTDRSESGSADVELGTVEILSRHGNAETVKDFVRSMEDKEQRSKGK